MAFEETATVETIVTKKVPVTWSVSEVAAHAGIEGLPDTLTVIHRAAGAPDRKTRLEGNAATAAIGALLSGEIAAPVVRAILGPDATRMTVGEFFDALAQAEPASEGEAI